MITSILIRFLDIILSLMALLILAPLILLVLFIVYFEDKKNPIFKQLRVKKRGELFTLYKIRSMRTNNGYHYTQKDDERITKIGRIIRHYKFDEVLQLVNVVIGDMSIVGPRPDIQRNIDLLQKDDKDVILSVKPGLSDYASLKYFHEEMLDKDEKMEEQILQHKVLLSKNGVAGFNLYSYFHVILLTLIAIVRAIVVSN